MSSCVFDFFESYIRAHSSLSDEEIAIVKSMAIPKQLKKKQYLLRQGDVCRFHTFVCSGCLRSYRIDDSGREHIFGFSTTNHWVCDRVSLVTGTPSEEFIDALEDSVIVQLSADSYKTLLRDIPNFDTLHTKIITEDCSRSRDRIYMMIGHQAEERYRQFIQLFPRLHQRLPVFMIASYIGVTRETLTRIRSNMTDLWCFLHVWEVCMRGMVHSPDTQFLLVVQNCTESLSGLVCKADSLLSHCKELTWPRALASKRATFRQLMNGASFKWPGAYPVCSLNDLR